MQRRLSWPNHNIAGLLIALVSFSLGYFLLVYPSRPSRSLTFSSYNLSFGLGSFTRPNMDHCGVIIVYIDEESLIALHQSLREPPDRSLHAHLLRRLKLEGARAVIMDIVFSDPGPNPEADREFLESLRENGRVVLAADFNPVNSSVIGSGPADRRTFTEPWAPLAAAAARIGLDPIQLDDDFTARLHFHEWSEMENAPRSLSWAAAELLDLPVTRQRDALRAERWINYYGPPETIPHVTFASALSTSTNALAPGTFRGKVVFVGARPKIGNLIEKRDELRNPYPSAAREFVFMPMVEVHATQFLNLARHDWLTRPSPWLEVNMLALAAITFGFGLARFRPLAATALALVGGIAFLLVSQLMFVVMHVWFPWLIIAAIQLPVALLGAFLFRSLDWIAHRRRLEEEQRRADLRIREQAALLDKARDAITVHDLEWRPLYWNKSAELLYGWSFAELEGKDLRTEVFKTDDARTLEALQQALARGEWSGELRLKARDGRELVLHSRWTLVRDDSGHPQSVLVINTDVSEQKKLEAQFLRTQRMESIGTLAGGIAHDLNNVLSPIVMGVELLKIKAQDPHSLKMLTTMGSSAKRGSDMVKQVLAFARGVPGERSVLQLSHLIREMQKIVNETFPKNIEFVTDVAEINPILGDATQMHQIILNLCVNARDAMPDGGRITVSARNAKLTSAEAARWVGARPIAYVVLSVADSGTGIPPEIIDKIFEPFFTTKEIGKGTGLGLSTVISIIKSHEGFLDLQTQVGRGTSFNVYLPAAENSTGSGSAPISLSDFRGNGETILLVDDEPAFLELTRNLLTHYGYSVLAAGHGSDALALFGTAPEKVKAVLVDIMMPILDGPATIRALRSRRADLPIIAISGLMQTDKLTQTLSTLAVDFIPKPCDTNRLLESLHSALRRRPIKAAAESIPTSIATVPPAVVATS